jgi:outer membrane protein, multidrug efflux system
MNFRVIVGILLAATALSGCNFAPKYVQPTGAVQQTLPQGGIYPDGTNAEADVSAIAWRDFFTDDRLRELIAQGLENNRDLRVAAANVLQARARYGIQRADRIPTTSLSGTATATNSVGTGQDGAAGGAETQSDSYEIYSLSAGFSAFEIDLFGRVRNLSAAARERYFATEEAQRAARISLIAEIAVAWLSIAADEDQLRLSRETLSAFEQTRTLTQAQFRVGVASELEARQADTNYQAARNDIAVLETRIAQGRNALELLVGAPVKPRLLPQSLGEGEATLLTLPNGLSSQVLLRRPDVLQAERELRAENANIGAARAALFPNISLTATIGTISGALSGLFGTGSFSYTASPAITLPIFDGGRARSNVRLAKATQQAALATYERTIQVAFRETSDALAQRGTIDEQIAAQTARTESAQVAERLSDARYRVGVTSFITALDAKRTAYAAQQQLVTTRLARARNLVELYRALGGGLN